jgi:hypothetical protein
MHEVGSGRVADVDGGVTAQVEEVVDAVQRDDAVIEDRLGRLAE